MKQKILSIILALLLTFPLLSPTSAFAITLAEEREMGKKVLKLVLNNFEIISDPLIVNYVNKIGKTISAGHPKQMFPYNIYVIKQDIHNAFAIPGGHIFIFSGLLADMKSEEELAGLISHEMSHVMCRHLSKRLERNQKLQVASAIGLLAAIALGASGSGNLSNAAVATTLAAGQTFALDYSREDEMQADQLGLKYMLKAGYSGVGMTSMLERLRTNNWSGTEEIPQYFLSHPHPSERIAYIGVLLDPNKQPDPKNPFAFNRMNARLYGTYKAPDIALARFKSELKLNQDDPITNYGYGLAISRFGKTDIAVKHFQKALKKLAFDSYILSDLGRVYFHSGNLEKAASTLDGAISIDKNNKVATYYRARTSMEKGLLEEARETFNKLLQTPPVYPGTYYYLGELSGKLGKTADAHYYLGLHYWNKKDKKITLFHLKKAVELLTDKEKKADATKKLDILKKQKKKNQKKTRSR